jgi:CDP-diacylglycerol--serine O-phosphatidyltransferase
MGLASITRSAAGDYQLAAWMILWATLLDKADGSAARLLKATSLFGVEFDSFADFVAFGLAPAALLHFRLRAEWGEWSGVGGVLVSLVLALYVVALAVRLARFNVAPASDHVFYGIPGTVLGALIAAAYLTWDKYQLAPELLHWSPLALVGAALLMVSRVELPKLKLRKSRVLNVLQIGNVVLVYLCGPLRLFPEYLFGVATVYLVGGVAWCLRHPAPVLTAVSGGKSHEKLAA